MIHIHFLLLLLQSIHSFCPELDLRFIFLFNRPTMGEEFMSFNFFVIFFQLCCLSTYSPVNCKILKLFYFRDLEGKKGILRSKPPTDVTQLLLDSLFVCSLADFLNRTNILDNNLYSIRYSVMMAF